MLRKAIQNNNELYSEIFAPQKIKSEQNDSIWYSLEKTPPLYSNLVTLSKDWKPDEVFRQIDSIYKNENWGEWSIKDSFATLDLDRYGFEKLFDAQWIYLRSSNFKPVKNKANLEYKIINNEKDLSNWRIAWDSDEKLGKEIFQPELLDNPKVYFVAGYDKQQIVSGCFINETEDVLGISNVITSNEDIDYWSGLIAFIFDSIKVADIVGYERKKLLREIQLLGLEAIGDLTVWNKKQT